jgi:hypothetical protein
VQAGGEVGGGVTDVDDEVADLTEEIGLLSLLVVTCLIRRKEEEIAVRPRYTTRHRCHQGNIRHSGLLLIGQLAMGLQVVDTDLDYVDGPRPMNEAVVWMMGKSLASTKGERLLVCHCSRKMLLGIAFGRRVTYIANELRVVVHIDGRRDEVRSGRKIDERALDRRREAVRAAVPTVRNGCVDGGGVIRDSIAFGATSKQGVCHVTKDLLNG